MLDPAESQYKNLHFHTPPWHPKEGFMKAYTISTKLSSSVRKKSENEISSHFQQNKNPVIFEAVRVKEDEAVRVEEDMCEVMSKIFSQKMKC